MIHVYPSDVMSHHVKYVYDSWSCMYANQHQPRGKELPHRDELRSQCQTLSSSNHDVKQYTSLNPILHPTTGGIWMVCMSWGWEALQVRSHWFLWQPLLAGCLREQGGGWEGLRCLEQGVWAGVGAWFVDILLTQWKTQFQDNPCVNMNHFGTISVVFSFFIHFVFMLCCSVAGRQGREGELEELGQATGSRVGWGAGQRGSYPQGLGGSTTLRTGCKASWLVKQPIKNHGGWQEMTRLKNRWHLMCHDLWRP